MDPPSYEVARYRDPDGDRARVLHIRHERHVHRSGLASADHRQAKRRDPDVRIAPRELVRSAILRNIFGTIEKGLGKVEALFCFLFGRVLSSCVALLFSRDAHRMRGVFSDVTLLSPVESFIPLRSFVAHSFLVRLRARQCKSFFVDVAEVKYLFGI
jgi:hypothetical protein